MSFLSCISSFVCVNCDYSCGTIHSPNVSESSLDIIVASDKEVETSLEHYTGLGNP